MGAVLQQEFGDVDGVDLRLLGEAAVQVADADDLARGLLEQAARLIPGQRRRSLGERRDLHLHHASDQGQVVGDTVVRFAQLVQIARRRAGIGCFNHGHVGRPYSPSAPIVPTRIGECKKNLMKSMC